MSTADRKNKKGAKIEIETDGMFKPKLIERGCWNCALGDQDLGKVCLLCMTTNKTRWRRKPKYKRKKRSA